MGCMAGALHAFMVDRPRACAGQTFHNMYEERERGFARARTGGEALPAILARFKLPVPLHNVILSVAVSPRTAGRMEFTREMRDYNARPRPPACMVHNAPHGLGIMWHSCMWCCVWHLRAGAHPGAPAGMTAPFMECECTQCGFIADTPLQMELHNDTVCLM